MIVCIRRSHNLSLYNLNFVAKHFLKETKVDLPIRMLFEKLCGGPKEIAECANYCVHDSYLPIRLMLKLSIIPNYFQMAKTTWVPMEWLIFKGQQCKSFSLLVRKAQLENYVVHVHVQNESAQGYQGATVKTPLTGIHYVPIAGLDFTSLYPSIIMAYNMCYSTYIESEEMLQYVKDNNIPYHTVAWDSEDGTHHEHSFVQIADHKGNELENGVRGIMGTILMELMKGRKATKKLMNAEKDPFAREILNGKQLAEKVTMNSMYGFAGAEKGILPCKPIAAGTTAIGRKMIDKTSQIASEEFGAVVIYGDSISPYEKITIYKTGETVDLPISEFADDIEQKWEEYRGFKIGDTEIKNKEYKNLDTVDNDYYTATHEGPQKINKIIRHETNKKMYLVKAKDKDGNIRSVKVTEDHSLVLSDGTLATPKDICVGSRLLDY